jgi:8-oxo-dGTP pyrophosphatase MutT (NUDIX family)
MGPTIQLFADEFIESAGAILFNSHKTLICMIHYSEKGEYVLPKGRRNVSESRATAALREAKEETGFSCHLLPVKMKTRAPPADEEEFMADVAVERECVMDPFA